MISRGDLYTPVVNAMRKNGGSASMKEIKDRIRWDFISEPGTMTDSDMLVLNVLSVIEDLERNGLIERIDGDLFTLSD